MPSPRWRATALVVLVLLSLVTAACGIDDSKVAGGDDLTVNADTPKSTIPPLDASDLRNVAENIQQFWAKTLPKLYGQKYQRIPDSRIIAGTPDADFPDCQGRRMTYQDVKGNAFAAPCKPEGITVVWDDTGLIPNLSKRFGAVAPAIVLAHEWGHVAQFQVGTDEPSIIMEQQADCFAGSWLHALIKSPGGLSQLTTESPLDTSLKTIIEVRDEPGSSTSERTAHGSGFDRVRALQEGFERGAAFCAQYPTKPPHLIDLQFSSEQDLETGGNLPLDDPSDPQNSLLPLVVQDLNDFYGREVTDFKGSSVDAVRNNDDAMQQLTDLHDRVGDNGAGLLLGLIWARFAQQQTGSNKGRDEFGQQLQRACLTGGWMADVLSRDPSTATLQFSPGDIDEAIIALIDLGTPKDVHSQSSDGGLFQLVSSLRQGVVQGFDSCGLKK
jgi:predicted metalloprotease